MEMRAQPVTLLSIWCDHLLPLYREKASDTGAFDKGCISVSVLREG